MEYIEVTGKSVDEAITNACLKLETSSDKIEYEVIDKGSNGLFGIFNSKPAKIKARVKSGVDSVDEEFKEFEKNEKKVINETIEVKKEAGKDLEGKGFDPRKLLAPGAEAIKATVKEKMELFGSVGKCTLI